MPSRFDLPDPRSARGDVVAVGGDLSPGTVLQAYRKGMFPMELEDGHLGWWCPIDRAVLPLDGMQVSRSLRQSTRRFTVTVDRNFDGVIAACATPDREGSWISGEFVEAYTELHRLGWAHSVEVWDIDEALVGGLYGISIGGLFAGESMFHHLRDASKVALVHIMVVMNGRGGSLLDIQWLTPHLASLGGMVVGRDRYLEDLSDALKLPGPFSGAWSDSKS
jgi:leucyl/phenylalanyl-tRNA--protein transferase